MFRSTDQRATFCLNCQGLSVSLQSPVAELQPRQLRVGKEWKRFDAVVLAADLPAASKLFPEIGSCKGTSSCTWYFALPSPPPVTEPLIVLNSTLQDDGDGPRLVDVAFPSLVQPSYAPAGWDLAAVTVRGEGQGQVDEAWLRSELEALFGRSLPWQLLRVYRLPFHQPSQSRDLSAREPRSASGVYLCGDHCAEPTLDSAMRSGRRAAEAVLKAGGSLLQRSRCEAMSLMIIRSWQVTLLLLSFIVQMPA